MKTLTFIAGIAAVVAAAAGASEYKWITTTVDNSHNVGQMPSLALDKAGRPHISYYNRGAHKLNYAYYDGARWRISIVDPNGNNGQYTSLALDAAAHRHVAYCYFPTWEITVLKYAYYDGATWRITTVDDNGNVGAHASLAVDAKRHPHIAYMESISTRQSNLRYAYFDGTAWHKTVVDNQGKVGYSNSIALDSKGNPHIAYCENDPYGVTAAKYAYYDGSRWHVAYVDKQNDCVHGTSLALDSADRPHISYQQDIALCLKYAYYDGARWRITVVDNDNVHGNTSITLDAGDHPHIAYNKIKFQPPPSEAALKYAYYDGSSWRKAVVERAGEKIYLGGWNSIALDSRGRPHIAYDQEIQLEDTNLKYAYATSLPAVELDYFTANPRGGEALVLSWSYRATAGEQVRGFNLYRREAAAAPKVPEDEVLSIPGGVAEGSWTKLNEATITGRNPYSFVDAGVAPGLLYEYKLEAVVVEGTETLGTAAGSLSVPRAFALRAAKPNPCSAEAVIGFDLSAGTDVDLSVYDLSGRKVATLAAGWLAPGAHERGCDVSALAPGVYVYRLTAGEWAGAKKMVVVR